MGKAMTGECSSAVREALTQAPVLADLEARQDSPTYAMDRELIELTGRRGFPVLRGVVIGQPAALQSARQHIARSQNDGYFQLAAWCKRLGPVYLSAGDWRGNLEFFAHAEIYDMCRAGRAQRLSIRVGTNAETQSLLRSRKRSKLAREPEDRAGRNQAQQYYPIPTRMARIRHMHLAPTVRRRSHACTHSPA